MKRNAYREIVNDILILINKKKLMPNDKIFSENQLKIKYGVSRIVSTRAYKMLQSIGAIYAIPKKGYYISEDFSGIVTPTPSLINGWKWKDKKIEYKKSLKHINNNLFLNKLSDNMEVLERTYYNDQDKVVAIAINWYDPNLIKIKEKDIIASVLVKLKGFKSSVSNFKFESSKSFGQNESFVNYQINYTHEGIPHQSKIYFNKSEFNMNVQNVLV